MIIEEIEKEWLRVFNKGDGYSLEDFALDYIPKLIAVAKAAHQLCNGEEIGDRIATEFPDLVALERALDYLEKNNDD